MYGHYKTNVLNARPAIDHHLIEALRVMSAAVSVHLESASPLIDVPTVRDPEIRRVDGSVRHTWRGAPLSNRKTTPA